MENERKLLYITLINEAESKQENTERLARFRGIGGTEIEKISYENVLDLFRKDSIEEQGVTYRPKNHSINKWTKSFASNRLQGNYFPAMAMDPFVARYVKAINGVGIKTYWSCDGWHSRKCDSLGIGFRDRNSKVWHKIITDTINDGESIEWIYKEAFAYVFLPKADEGKIEIYKAINRRAEYLERKQAELLQMKIDIISKVKGKRKNMLSDEELEAMLRWHLEEH